MAVKVTMVFQVTTQPVNPSQAVAHSGGWTESLWTPGNSYVSQPDLNALIGARRPLLPAGAAIVGVRQGLYTIAGNKLLPQGTSGYKVNAPGSTGYTVNLPQDSLELSGTSQTSINSNRFRIGCLPDEMVAQGEYNPTPGFSLLLQNYRNLLSNGLNAWSFIGRVLSNFTARVVSIVPGVGGAATLTLSSNIGITPGQDYIRLKRVYDNLGRPVKGTYLVSASPSLGVYTLVGFPLQTVNVPSGTAIKDELGIFRYAAVNVSRAVVKKIGRPSQSYRGRQSRRTPA